MRKFNMLLLLIFAFVLTGSTYAQEVVKPTVIKKAVGFAISSPLKDNPVITGYELQNEEFYMNKHKTRKIDPNIKPPDFSRMPIDPGNQTQMGWIDNSAKALNKNFAGQNSGSYPPDCNGAVNSDYFFQTVNTTYAIYDKNGTLLAGPSALNSIFNSSLPGAGYNDGDPIVLWDEQANRWFYAEFSLSGSNDYMLIAVSTSADPTGTWYSWSFDVADTPDYMKFGIWQDGYYMATNTSNGNDVYVFERDKMIAGNSSPQMIGFDNPNRPSTFDGFHCIMPLDNDGAWAPAGTPGLFITVADDGQSNSADALYVYQLDVNWTTPSSSTFARTQTLNVNAFSGNFTSDWNNIPQPGTTQKLDGISTVLMYRAQYRNFNGTQKIVCNHTIAESSTESAIRWYELTNTGSGWSISQQGTYNPDTKSRWNASIAMNSLGQIAMGYSISDGTSTYPGIRYTGQTTNAPSGVMDVAETTIWTGAYSQKSYNRWGDYAGIDVDPTDGTTFWFTSEYMGSTTHGTRIAGFTLDETVSCTPPTTKPSNFSTSNLADNSMTVSWTRGNGTSVLVVAHAGSAVNSDPVSGTSYTANAAFGSGSQIGTGNYVIYKGTGTSVNVTGLSTATTYHYAIYEFNTADNCYNITELAGSATTTGVTYCASQGNSVADEWIAGVKIGTFNNTSGAAGYTNFTGTVVNLTPGTAYALTLTPGFSGTAYNEYWKIWIDYNKNGSFDDSGELVFDAGAVSNTVKTGTFTVLASASGSTRMRVSMKYNAAPTSCEAFSYGEVEDYTATFSGVANIAPVAEANGPYSGARGANISFSSAGSTDSDGTIASYSWNFGDGSTSTTANPTHAYTTAGTYTAVLTVTDNGGLTDTDNATVTVTATNVAPVAEANGPYSGNTGVAISFSSAGTTDSDGTIASYSWNFGDGTTSTSANPTHAYTAAGTYTAVLTVTDNGGLTDTDNATVTVTTPSGSYASLPYSTGFESGFDTYWTTKTSSTYGRILIATANTPHTGTKHLTMDVTTNGNYATNEAWLKLNLSGYTQSSLSFWWKDFGDETHTTDGVYFSADGGTTFVKVQDLNGASYTDKVWRQFTLDVDQLCASKGISMTSTFVVKFQQYDNYVIATDGMAFDDIAVTGSNDTNTDPPTGYCASKGSNSSYEWIDLVQLGSINNVTGNNSGYADFTSMSTDLINGNSYTINFSAGFASTSYLEYWHVYIDYNRDGDFADTGEALALGSSSSSATLSGTINVPASTSLGYTRMRVVMKYNAASTGSCETFSYGEVEDYLVYLTPVARSKESVVYEPGFEIGYEDDMFTLYPNPASEFVNVRLPENSNVTVKIIDLNGKLLKTVQLFGNNEIDISDLARGVYVLDIFDGRKSTVQRMVKY
jgi:PKD repeat protein